MLANKSFNKIFCIGYNKTGTTSLEYMLRLYGYSVPNQQDQEIRLTRNVSQTNYTQFVEFISDFDAFQDRPFSEGLTYVAANALFPNSKFILSIRDSDAWFNSLTSFHRKIYGIDTSAVSEQDIYEKCNYLFKDYFYSNKKRFLTRYKNGQSFVDWSKLYDKDYYIQQYEQRNEQIIKYFINAPEKLLIIDVTKEKSTEKLVEFLNIPKELVIDMPHRNKT